MQCCANRCEAALAASPAEGALHACRDEPVEFVAQVATRQGLYPVSMEWDPPFTMMVDLIGHGDLQVRQFWGCMICLVEYWQMNQLSAKCCLKPHIGLLSACHCVPSRAAGQADCPASIMRRRECIRLVCSSPCLLAVQQLAVPVNKAGSPGELLQGCCSFRVLSQSRCAQSAKPFRSAVLQAGADVSAFLSAWGAWQPALDPFRSPSVADALIGSLGGHGSERRVSFFCSNIQRSHGQTLKSPPAPAGMDGLGHVTAPQQGRACWKASSQASSISIVCCHTIQTLSP